MLYRRRIFPFPQLCTLPYFYQHVYLQGIVYIMFSWPRLGSEWRQRLTRRFDADFPSTADGTLFLVDPSKCIRFLSPFPVAFPCRILPIVSSLVVIKHLMEIPQNALLPFESSSMEHMFEGLKR